MPNPTKSLTALAAILAVCLTPARSQQPTSEAVPGSYIIRLERRPAALEELRDLIRAGAGVSRTNAKIEELLAWIERQSGPVAKSAEELGARVGERWWILPGLRVDGVSPEAAAALRRHPDVASVHPNRIHAPLNETARNSLHHRADQVEQMTLPNGQRIDGSGVAVAVLDSGADRDFAGTGLPHPAYFPGGDQTQTTGPGLDGSRLLAAYGTSGFGIEDQDGHGAHVSGSVGSAAAGYRGIAQGSSIVSIKVSHPPIANATSAALIAAWQLTVQTRPQHDIRVANNSYSGSPDLTDPTQVALDNAAYVGDLLVVCSAGNAGADTTRSQNCWNGLAVGNVLKSSLAANSRSAQGPLAIFGRTFPDIAAVGTLVQSTALDTASPAVLTGTSMAAPMVAGAGALLFQARPDLTAIEAKAILLGSTRHTQTAPNTLGRGVLDAKAAVDRALGDGFTTLRFEGDEDRLGFVHCVEEPGPVRITAAWMHPGGQAFDNVDLRVYDGSQLIVADLNPLTSYEHVEFMGVPGRRYHVELSRPMPASPSTLEVAVSISNHDFRPDSPVRLARTFHIAEIGTRLDKTIGSPNDRYFADLGRVQLHADLSYTRTADTFEMSDGGAVSISPDSGIGFYTTTEGDGRIHLDAGGTRAGTTAILDRSGTWAVFGRDDRPRVPYTGTRTPAESWIGLAIPVASTPADDTTLNGTYHLLTKRLELIPEPVNGIYELHTATVLGTATFDGAGAFSFSGTEAEWDPFGNRSTGNVAGNGSYAVQPDGAVSIGPDTSGAVSDDGDVFFLVTRGPGSIIELIVGTRRSTSVQIDDTTGPWSKFLHGIAADMPPTLTTQRVQIETAFEHVETARASTNAGTWQGFETTVFHENGSTTIDTSAQPTGGTYTLSPLGWGTAVFVDGAGRPTQARISPDATFALSTDQATRAELGLAVHAAPCRFAVIYGTASASPSNQPIGIGVADHPQLGNTDFGLTIAGASQQLATAILAFRPAGGTPLLGGRLWVDLQATLGSASALLAQSPGHVGGGIATIPVPLPATSSLHGLTLYAQAIGIELAAPAGLVMSPGLRFTLYQ